LTRARRTTHQRVLGVLLLSSVVAGLVIWTRLAPSPRRLTRPPGPAASATPSPPGTNGAGAAGRPNVLLIVTDDQREGLEVMPKTRSWLVRQGTTYEWAFATTPLCCPSRASIMTGRYAHNHLVRTNAAGQVGNLDQRTTLQYYLRSSGYRTAIFGKYLNKWPLEVNPPHFDRWAIFSATPDNVLSAYVGGPWNVDGVVEPISTYSTRFLRDLAVGFIRNNRDRPWFVYVAPPAPHRPFLPEPVYADAAVPAWDGNPAVSERDKSDKPPYVRASNIGLERGQDLRSKQLRTLMSVDDLVDGMLTALRDSGQLDGTMVFLLSDNGYLWGEHGLLGKPPPYLQATRVPFLARWPGHLGRGDVERRLVANIDIAPTVLDAAGVMVDPAIPMDGRSLLDTAWRRDRLVLENFWAREAPKWSSTVTPEFQYVEYYDLAGETITFSEYYDLTTDVWQLTNLLHDGDRRNNPDQAALHAVLTRDRACVGRSCP
jgi:arylsulfatase A-like enzyme